MLLVLRQSCTEQSGSKESVLEDLNLLVKAVAGHIDIPYILHKITIIVTKFAFI